MRLINIILFHFVFILTALAGVTTRKMHLFITGELRIMFWSIIFIISVFAQVASLPCIPRDYGKGSFVCVCNASYCDTVEPNGHLPEGKYATYTSSQDGYRLNKALGQFKENLQPDELHFVVNRSEHYQTILGFGGAFTDSTGINIASLQPKTAGRLMKAYFSSEGLEYTVGRIPMASCDFSTRVYSYDDVSGDFDLKHFALAPEDYKYKIPYIHWAQKLSARPITLFASPWSSPGWMKNSGKMPGNGTLRGKAGDKYHKSWALYFAKFLEEYSKNKISIWGVTAQNEPMTGFYPNYPFQTLGFTAETQRDFIAQDLGPTLEQHGFGDVKIMVLDDQRTNLPQWPQTIMQLPEAAKYVSGVAVHWYLDFIDPAFPLSMTHEALPDLFILYTEACEGYQVWDKVHPVSLGNWDRFESYVKNIMDDLANWVAGWTDWNMALDLEGGPNWVKNFVDSPIIINKTSDEFYKQPMYYAMGHFSKFLPKGSVRIGLNVASISSEPEADFQALAFLITDGSIVIQINNRGTSSQSFQITDPKRGIIQEEVPARALKTIIWW